MGKNYYRNTDDVYSDPDLIASKYQIGRNGFFEVALTLAEQADNLKAASSSSAASAAGVVGAGSVIGGGWVPGGCPREDQWLWAGDHDSGIIYIQAGVLVESDRNWKLYNPLTRRFNRVIQATKMEDQPMWWHQTSRQAAAIVTHTHKSIRRVGDINGGLLRDVEQGGELMMTCIEMQGDKEVRRIYQDVLADRKDAGMGTAIKISLDEEFIYAVGIEVDKMTIGHNRKADLGDETF